MRTRQRGRLWSSHQFAQEPEQPVVTDAQALTPGRLRDVGEAAQDGPGAQATCGQRPHDIGQYTPQEVVRSRQASHPLKGLQGAGLLGEVRGQTRHDLCRPGIFHEGKGLALDHTAGIMALDQHDILLKMVVMVSLHHSTGRPCWS